MEKKTFQVKQNKDIPEMHQTYKCEDTVINVEPIFKTTGKRTLFDSLGLMVHKEAIDSEQS